jgi:Protein of unknown function (DUF2541)
MNTRYFLLPLALLALSLSLNAAADPARKLGSTFLTKAENDRDVLRFATCRRDINAIQLSVVGARVEIESLWVRFANGNVETLSVRDRIGKGGATRWIDLRGGERCVSAIGVIGDSENAKRQARVTIWGR